jgi:hypothetical protein
MQKEPHKAAFAKPAWIAKKGSPGAAASSAAGSGGECLDREAAGSEGLAKKRKVMQGICKCGLCGGSSKDTIPQP